MTMDNLDHSKKVLSSLTELGIRISIDDFGTGHSSLSYLKDFPIHRLKIDKSFIDDIQTHPKSEQITGAIIAMGHQLSLQVIAEGVENAAQKRLPYEKGATICRASFSAGQYLRNNSNNSLLNSRRNNSAGFFHP